MFLALGAVLHFQFTFSSLSPFCARAPLFSYEIRWQGSFSFLLPLSYGIKKYSESNFSDVD